MALHDSDIKQSDIPNGEDLLSKSNKQEIGFADYGFYPFLKFLINYTTKIPNDNIRISGFGEDNPFLDQSNVPKVFVEQIMYNSPMMSGGYDSEGNVAMFMETTYRVYFVNDTYRETDSPYLKSLHYAFEASLKADTGKLGDIATAFYKYADTNKVRLFKPSQITMLPRKNYMTNGLYPIITIDVSMNGYINYNDETLKNKSFNEAELGIILQTY